MSDYPAVSLKQYTLFMYFFIQWFLFQQTIYFISLLMLVALRHPCPPPRSVHLTTWSSYSYYTATLLCPNTLNDTG